MTNSTTTWVDAPDLILGIDAVSRAFDGVKAVDRVSISVPRNAIYGLVGPNGAGKSTLLNLLGGQLKPDAGRVVFDGHDITKVPDHRRARRGIIRTFQRTAEFPRLTVLENLLVARRGAAAESIGDIWWRRRSEWEMEEARAVRYARYLLAQFDLLEWQDEYAERLSGGQRRILELLRAAMAEPVLLLLDEPVAGVHPEMIERICRYLEELRANGVTILMVEHALNVVDRLCDQAVVMAEGRILFVGELAVARRRPDVIDAYLGSR